MVKAIDATGLSAAGVAGLKAQGVQLVGRYLSKTTWKGLSPAEIARIKAAGMEIFSIYETSPTHASYFSYAQGQADASAALSLAKAAGQPTGTAIYFTVDYDAQARDFAAIVDYFKAVNKFLTGYKVGAYGSYSVLTELQGLKLAVYWFQTIAWSGGKRLAHMHIYQAQTNEELAGVNVDIDEILVEDIGAWGQPKAAPAPTPKPTPAPTPPKPATAPAAPAVASKAAVIEEKINFIVKNLFGDKLGHVHEYIRDKGWWFAAVRNPDDSLDIEVGIFIKGSQSFLNFQDFLVTEKYTYIEKKV